ncbi:FkbM family methyltransferase [Natronorubrum halophilum]|uniref:FkbM family methyltransferase n=1 Tax=Natronorubrum halophilum TaxID=1702106 RepID=UPI000EF6EAFC|nr:FkbM family methyltransferase [Natronorubrum halophilum]
MVIKTVVETSRCQIRDVHKRAINAGLAIGLVDDIATLHIGNVSVDFRTQSQKERWRARSAMGEADIFEFLERHLEDDDVFWDVGAAVGTYSVFAATLVDRVVAFEPEPLNLSRIRENTALNGLNNVQAMRYALSSSPGSARLERKDGVGHGGHTLSPEGSFEVDVIRGDTIDPAPDVIKIDVEGHEAHVLDGLGDHLDTVRTVIVEVHEDALLKDVLEPLERAGLEVEEFGDRDSLLGGGSGEFHLLARR